MIVKSIIGQPQALCSTKWNSHSGTRTSLSDVWQSSQDQFMCKPSDLVKIVGPGGRNQKQITMFSNLNRVFWYSGDTGHFGSQCRSSFRRRYVFSVTDWPLILESRVGIEAPKNYIISADIRTFFPALVFKWSKTRAGKKVPVEQIIVGFSRNGRKQGGGKRFKGGEKGSDIRWCLP